LSNNNNKKNEKERERNIIDEENDGKAIRQRERDE
jgi:hypothetical protein